MSSEISIVPFKFKYLKDLHELLETNGFPDIKAITMKSLPKIGYICYFGEQPLASGFLRRVEGGYGQIDTLTSNKMFGSIIRHEGIKLIVDTLIAEAQVLQMHGIISFTKDAGILARAQSIGFKHLETNVVVLKLD